MFEPVRDISMWKCKKYSAIEPLGEKGIPVPPKNKITPHPRSKKI
jgi:hypothetical protein